MLVLAAASVVHAQTATTPPQPFFDWSKLQFDEAEHSARRHRLANGIAAAEAGGSGVYLAPAQQGRSDGETFRQLDDFLYFTGLELPDSVLTIEAGEGGRATLVVPVTDARFESASRPNDFPGRALIDDADLLPRSGVDAIRSIDELDTRLAEWTSAGSTLWVNVERPGPVVGERAAAPAGAPAPIARRPVVDGFVDYLRRRQPDARLLNAYPEIAALRMIKSAAEVDALRAAAKLTVTAIGRAARHVRPGVDERTLQGEFEAGCRAGGAQRIPFTPIVKSGPNSLWPWRLLAAHYNRRNRSMEAGDLVILDVGCEINGYISDIGRTFPVSGAFTPRQEEILTMEIGAANAIIAAIRPGTTLPELQRIGEATIPAEHRK